MPGAAIYWAENNDDPTGLHATGEDASSACVARHSYGVLFLQ
jgi:hypothetical protein